MIKLCRVIVAALLTTNGYCSAESKSQVAEVILAVDRAAVSMRQRALNEIDRQAAIEEKRVIRAIDRLHKSENQLKTLNDEQLLVLQDRVDALMETEHYVEGVIGGQLQRAVDTPIGVRSIQGLRQERSRLVREQIAVRKRIADGEQAAWLPNVGEVTANSLHLQVMKQEEERDRFRKCSKKGTLTIEFPGPLGRVTGQQLKDGIAEREENISDVTVAIDSGDYAVGQVPHVGVISRRQLIGRVGNIEGVVAGARTGLEQQGMYIFRHGVGQITQRQLEKKIDSLVAQREALLDAFEAGLWAAPIPVLGKKNRYNLEKVLNDKDGILAVLRSEIESEHYKVVLPDFAGGLTIQDVKERLISLEGMDGELAARQRRKLESALQHIITSGKLAVKLEEVKSQQCERGIVLLKVLFEGHLEEIDADIEDLKEYRLEFNRDFQEFVLQKKEEARWLTIIGEQFLP